jgi:GT2 family glycosyltransferase
MNPVSIIMKTWNALPHVRLCVRTLLCNTDGPFELIVIDNGSRPEMVSFLTGLAQEDARVRLVANRENVGPGAANRQGVALARNDLVCLIDSDVLVPHRWLSRLVAEFERHPGIKLLAPLSHNPAVGHPFGAEDSATEWFRVKQDLPRLSPLRQFHAYSRGLSIDEFDELMCSSNAGPLRPQACPPDFIGTACALLDKHFVAAAGGVADPRFVRYGSEDVDLCWRAGERGGQVARTGVVYVHHFCNASLADNAADPGAALRIANSILYAKWQVRLIGLCQAELARGGSLRDYLASHFIFQPLARDTSFLADLTAATGRTDIPDQVVWRPERV